MSQGGDPSRYAASNRSAMARVYTPVPRRQTSVAVPAARRAGAACSVGSPMHGHHDDDDDHDDDNDRSRANSNPSTCNENNLGLKHELTSRIERYGGELRSPSAGPRDPGSDLAAPSLL